MSAAIETLSRHDAALFVMRAPRIEPESLLATGGEGLLWCAPGEEMIAGLGVAARIEARGKDRFQEIREAGSKLLSSIEIVGAPPIQPRLFGGFAFDPGDASWPAFGDASFTLPRWLRGDSWLALTVLAGDGDETRARLLAEIPRRLAGAPFVPQAPRSGELVIANGFEDSVRCALASIDGGALSKVVLSESAHARCEASPLAIAAALRRVPGWRFLLEREGVSFVGVSPERLVRKRGHAVEVDALAGSRRNGDDDALASSHKDREEQRIVGDEIARALAPFSTDVALSPPSPKRFAHVTHLHSAITATLARDDHVLDLAAALHPTPAVGGAPRAAALAAIRAIEREPRGWWAAPIGWFDAKGDGELVVAIRSARLENGVAHLRTGAGIVRGSQPDGERAELSWKRRALLDALGVS